MFTEDLNGKIFLLIFENFLIALKFKNSKTKSPLKVEIDI